ncbi:PREDICTED: uncharacterized protein LOC108354257 [Rhagoletis zephyria]|uniref:uncharacterized protein LOC108354257 n=1 Tax=Rhagoletis zephyria TaxID=28612 RepID=UPI000811834C|nr:PREDICTED: uncharacterized protein LOC108354257 [Rhagoletis zephyria]XP_017460951.1 PREDICTED: uncharacterized protein LOC108354257 [Rhagoletis zephyria]
MPFLPVYYPKYMLRRKRVQILPPKKYPYRGILPMNQNGKRNPYRYFALGYLPGSTSMLKNVKWPNYAFPYKSFNAVTTPKTNYYMLTPEKLNINFHSREPYFTNPISSMSSVISNYCVNAHKVGANYAHILPFCIDKVPTLPTPLAKVRSNNTKYISSTLRMEPSTRNPYTQDVFSTSSHLKSINTSHIYFTIGDAITPRALVSSDFKKEKKATNFKNYETFLSNDYNKPKSDAIASEQWTMASNPINLQQKAKLSQPTNEVLTYHLTSSQDFNPFALTDTKATQMHWSLDQFENITCSNSLLDTKTKCASENKDHTEDNISTEVSTTLTVIRSLPIVTTIAFTTVSTPLIKVPQLDNISTTVSWNFTQEPYTSSSRPTYRRGKIAQINRRLVFKEKIKEKDRISKSSTMSIPIRTTEAKTKEKRKYTASTFPSPSQIISSSRTTQLGSLLRVNNTLKKRKIKFHTKNRSRWSPSNEKTNEKVKGANTPTSTIITTILNSTTEPQRSTKSSKLRLKVSRHNRRSTSLQIAATRSLPQSTTPVASSTPESAIMRISNMGTGKNSIAKNNSSNSILSFPTPSSGFVAELPIVTYFKEIAESRQI